MHGDPNVASNRLGGKWVGWMASSEADPNSDIIYEYTEYGDKIIKDRSPAIGDTIRVINPPIKEWTKGMTGEILDKEKCYDNKNTGCYVIERSENELSRAERARDLGREVKIKCGCQENHRYLINKTKKYRVYLSSGETEWIPKKNVQHVETNVRHPCDS